MWFFWCPFLDLYLTTLLPLKHTPVSGEIWALPVEILVFPSPTRYMLTSFGFPFIKLGYIL